MIKSASPPRPETRDRIIAAAGEVFAERGFRATTIRQITARARVNLAAVNYHFRDKGELYTRVLREAKKHVTWIRADDLHGNAEERLAGFIRRFVSSLLAPQRPSWHGRVIAMEMANPTPALNMILRELTTPFYRDLSRLINNVVDGKAAPAQLDLFTLSIIGQCVFYACSRPAVEQLAVDLGRQPKRTDKIAEHIAAFSLSGLKSFRRKSHLKSAAPSRRRAPSLISS